VERDRRLWRVTLVRKRRYRELPVPAIAVVSQTFVLPASHLLLFLRFVFST